MSRLTLATWLGALLLLPQWAAEAGVTASLPHAIQSVHQQIARQRYAEAKAAEFKSRWPMGYNPAASVVARPSTPLAPTSPAECRRYRDTYQQIIRDVSDHHWACIASTKPRSEPYSFEHVNAGFRNFGRTQDSVCSNPACETLHKAMIDMTDSANAGSDKCMDAVNRHQKAEADKAARWKSKRE
ncbi:hypothetical protein [Hydrogenophaga sp.]|uniref:hypothetical protein n=1 Tax=Hydrogenophaga sp. TaxID=1904254 RepID=UPI002602912C|nr:hypothetical protein [Hydrogenophaga sp.]MCW5654545.1 hypothetical protein [Hydrogenophaga sp.]